MLLNAEQAFVGIDHLFQIHIAVEYVCECRICIEIPVKGFGLPYVQPASGVYAGQDSPGEIPSDGDEVQIAPVCRLKPADVHSYFFKVLMFKCLIY